MIQNIFLPEKIKNYYLFDKRIAALDIGKMRISVCISHLKGNDIIIEDSFIEKIDTQTGATHEEHMINALQALFKKCKKIDAVYVSIPSAYATFKELQLPFSDHNKIAMVLPFEVEQLLPFPVAQAALDFIITKKNSETGGADVLVAAVQKNIVEQYLHYFTAIGIDPEKIVLDSFALYNLCEQIPTYKNMPGAVGLVDIGLSSSRISFINDGQLKLIRTIPHALSQVARAVSESLQISPAQAMEMIIRFGLENPENQSYVAAVESAFGDLWNNISFTLNSFLAQTSQASQAYTTVLLLGEGAEIKGEIGFIQERYKLPCQLFDSSLITTIPHLSCKNGGKHISAASLASIGAAIPTPLLEEFSIYKPELSSHDYRTLIKQSISALILLITLLGLLIGFVIIQTTQLSSELYYSEQEALDTLKERFKSIESDETDLDSAIDAARQQLAKDEETWFAFSNKSRFLQYLLELDSKIDRESLGLVADQLIITENTITLKGQVKDHEALKNLEKELRSSKLFSHVGPLEDPVFTVKITLARSLERQ